MRLRKTPHVRPPLGRNPWQPKPLWWRIQYWIRWQLWRFRDKWGLP